MVAAAALTIVGMASVATGQASAPPASTPVQPVPSGVAAQNMAILSIRGGIDDVTASSIERRMTRAVEDGANVIVIDLDTPGGEVPAVLQICRGIEMCPVHTIAWINPNAYSGGAIIALACDEIVMASSATLGDAAPVHIHFIKGIAKITDPEERQKQLAPVLAQVVNSAREQGYDEVLVQGMVSLGVRTWMVEDTRSGRRYFLTEHEYTQLFGRKPEVGLPMVASGGDANAYEVTPVDPGLHDADSITGFRPASGQFDASLTEKVSESLDGRAATSRPDFSREDPANYIELGYATDGQTLLTVKGPMLRTFGFVDYPHNIDTDADMQAYVGATNVVRLDQTWLERAVAFMTQGVSGLLLRGFLIVVFLLAMFIELSMPGVGVPGVIALCALVLLIAPPMLLGASVWWAVVAIIGGVGLIVLEILVFPGFGVPGILGMLMLLGGLVGTFMTGGALFPGSGMSSSAQLFWGVSTVLLALFAAGTAMFFVSKYTRSIPIANRLVLAASLKSGAEAEQSSSSAAVAVTPSGIVAIGAIGVTTTPLRPSGTAEFGDRLIDVVAEFGFIDAGERVRVVNASQYRIGVEAVQDQGSERGA